MEALKLEDEHKVKVLLQEEAHAVLQMENLKKEEMSWLKVFLLFYGAVMAWAVSRWLISPMSSPLPTEQLESEFGIISTTLCFTWVATCLFAFLFFQARQSYYGVRKRVERIQAALFLDKEGIYGDEAIFGGMKVESVDDYQSWKDITKPTSSFMTRMVYIIGSNLAVIIIAYLSLYKMQYPVTLSFAGLFIAMTIFIFIFAWFIDYHSFTKKKK
ncbi:MAG: hypothetical protein K6L74_13180 [Neptuniibacter sp.]